MTITTHSLSLFDTHTQPNGLLPLYQCDAFSSDPALCHSQVHDFCDDASTYYNISSCNRARYCCLIEIDGHILHFDDEHILQYSASGSESMEYAELDAASAHFDIQMVHDDNEPYYVPHPQNTGEYPCDADTKQLELRYLSMSPQVV